LEPAEAIGQRIIAAPAVNFTIEAASRVAAATVAPAGCFDLQGPSRDHAGAHTSKPGYLMCPRFSFKGNRGIERPVSSYA
jgi:hypothetical protein